MHHKSARRLSQELVTFGGKSYELSTVFRREPAAATLKKWLLEGRKARDLDLKGESCGNRKVGELEGGFVVKETRKARDEFLITVEAEDLTNLTPVAGAVLTEQGSSWGAISVELFRGIPVVLLDKRATQDLDRERVRNGVLYAMGTIHRGDGKTSLMHMDAHMGNALVLPNPQGADIKIATQTRAEVRLIDLEKARTMPFGKGMIVSLMFDLILAINQLMYAKMLHVENALPALESYLEGNPRMDMADLKRFLREEILHHPKLIKARLLLPVLQ
jgi:hypothetical protein